MRTLVCTLVIAMSCGALARGQQANVRIAFDDGRVTLAATDALVTDVLAEWARVGGTVITGADRIPPARITVNLVAIDEWSAIVQVIGSANGILATGRTDGPAGGSRLATVLFALPLPATAAAGPAPASGAAGVPTPTPRVDVNIPEARFSYPAPVGGGSPDDTSSIAANAHAVRLPSTPASAAAIAPLLMPEMRFQYVVPIATLPESTDSKPDDRESKARKQP
jgi:hypothetical protein